MGKKRKEKRTRSILCLCKLVYSTRNQLSGTWYWKLLCCRLRSQCPLDALDSGRIHPPPPFPSPPPPPIVSRHCQCVYPHDQGRLCFSKTAALISRSVFWPSILNSRRLRIFGSSAFFSSSLPSHLLQRPWNPSGSLAAAGRVRGGSRPRRAPRFVIAERRRLMASRSTDPAPSQLWLKSKTTHWLLCKDKQHFLLSPAII